MLNFFTSNIYMPYRLLLILEPDDNGRKRSYWTIIFFLTFVYVHVKLYVLMFFNVQYAYILQERCFIAVNTTCTLESYRNVHRLYSGMHHTGLIVIISVKLCTWSFIWNVILQIKFYWMHNMHPRGRRVLSERLYTRTTLHRIRHSLLTSKKLFILGLCR